MENKLKQVDWSRTSYSGTLCIVAEADANDNRLTPGPDTQIERLMFMNQALKIGTDSFISRPSLDCLQD
jgi:hypothetical protein